MKTKWLMLHPGGLEYALCDTYKDAMKLFEGFNVPRKIRIEGFKKSHARVERKICDQDVLSARVP